MARVPHTAVNRSENTIVDLLEILGSLSQDNTGLWEINISVDVEPLSFKFLTPPQFIAVWFGDPQGQMRYKISDRDDGIREYHLTDGRTGYRFEVFKDEEGRQYIKVADWDTYYDKEGFEAIIQNWLES